MAGSRYVVPYAYAYRPTGEPIDGALLNFYVTSSSTVRANTYSDATLSTPNPNPVVANASGTFPNIFLDPNVVYRVVLTYPVIEGAAEVWTADPVSSDNSGTIAYSGTATYARGTVGYKLQQFINPMDSPWNANGTGNVDDYAAFSAADVYATSQGLPLWITKTHLLNTDYTPTSNLIFAGGKVKIANTKTLTVITTIEAPISQIFDVSLGGEVDLFQMANQVAYPEWWGALANTSGFDCLASFNSALASARVVQCQQADYYFSGTIKQQTQHTWLRGYAQQYNGAVGTATRLIVNSATLPTLQMGPDASPGTLNDFYMEIRASDVCLTRSIAPNVPSNCASVLIKYTLYAELENVRGIESINGFFLYGNVHIKLIDCYAFRSVPGTGGADKFYGFCVDGSAVITASNGNASVYINRCSASGGTVIANSAGAFADGGMTDLFIDQLETATLAAGIILQGDASATYASTNQDIQINDCILDQFAVEGIRINNMNKFGSVEINGGWYGPSPGATAAIYVTSSNCTVDVNGGQLGMHAAPAAVGILIDTSTCVIVRRASIADSGTNPVQLNNSSNCDIRPFIKNQGTTTTKPAVELTGTCTRNYVQPFVQGLANAFTVGVNLAGASNANNEINCTGIDPACIAGGSANKLVINAIQVTATGLSGSNYISGVMT